jgi:UDP-N-acetyl-D-glucosamine dehydrogenase
MTYVVQAAEDVAATLRPGQLIVLESTSYPGTTREVLLPMLEAGGLRVGQDFFLAYSPERVDPGRTDWTTTNTPKVVGGVTPACLEAALELYGVAVERLVPVSSPEVAEMAKVYENTFRAVNIGLANELLLMSDRLGIDAWEVLDAASTKPFGFMRFTPGPGLGGHCIPIDPHYLSWKLRGLDYVARFIELASEVNTQMPAYWVQRVQDALNERGKAVRGSSVLVLGVAYKPDVADLRESPALDILLLLVEKGANVRYHDPHVPALQHGGVEMTSVEELEDELASADAVVVATDHSEYRLLDLSRATGAVVNTRGPRRAGVDVEGSW